MKPHSPHHASRPRLCISSSRRRRITGLIAALGLAAAMIPTAARAQIVPSGGDFETVPTTWSMSGSAGLLSTISAAQVGDASNHYLRTTYQALAGSSLVGLTAHETITSPTFTWSQATPQAIAMSLDRRATLGGLAGVNGGVSIAATLHDLTSGVTSTLLSNAITTSSSTFQTVSAAESPSLLSSGDEYQLVVTETVSPLVLVVGTATIDLDNVGLDVTPAAPPAPVLIAGSAAIGQVTSTSAQATATIDPGSTDTTVTVRYGTTTAYGSQVSETIPADSGPTAVVLPISGLTPATAYHAEIVASSTAGSVASSDLGFTTSSQPPGTIPPSVTASMVDGTPGERAATLAATIDTGGQGASYYVEYGPTASYGSATTSQTLPAGTTGGVPVTVDLSGLQPGTAYHARIVAMGPGGTTDGSDVALTTAAAQPPTVTAPTVAVANSPGTSVTVATTVDPGANDSEVGVSYGTSTAYGTTTATQLVSAGSGPTGAQFLISGLTPGTTYHFRVTASNADGTVNSSDVAYTPSPSATPPVGPTELINDAEQSATLSSSIDPGGSAATYQFVYGTSPSSLSTSTTMQSISAGTTGAQPLTASLAGLFPGTTYYGRFVVDLSGGASSQGEIYSFTTDAATPPVIDATSLTDLTPQSVTLRTIADPGTHPTQVYAQYGLTDGYGLSSPVVTIPAGAGPTVVSLDLTGLTADTTYHVRLVLVNADGTVDGTDIVFTSPGATTGAGSTTTVGTGGGAGAGTGTVTKRPATGPACLAGYVSAPARALRVLALPIGAEVTTTRPLLVVLRPGRWAGVSYRIARGHVTLTRHRSFSVPLSALRPGRTTAIVVRLSRRGRRGAVQVRFAVSALPCGLNLSARRLAGSRVAVTVRSALGLGRVALIVPAGWTSRSVTSLSGGLVSVRRVLTVGGRPHVVAGGRLSLRRVGRVLLLAGLGRRATGITVAFTVRPGHGRVIARATPSHGTSSRTAQLTLRWT